MEDLLIVNFAMDSKNPLLSHQIDTVEKLAPNFRQVCVLTASQGDYESNANIKIYSTSWAKGKPIRNILFLYWRFFQILKSEDISVVFSHMTDLQSAFLVPITKFLGIRHYLWYAHKTKSKYLSFASYFLDGILTSTIGSCPITSKKVIPIGQGVDSNKFRFVNHFISGQVKMLHVGRFDPPKRIQSIIDAAIKVKELGMMVSLTLIGDPSNELARNYADGIKGHYSSQSQFDWITFSPSINRDELPELLQKFDVFVHSYMGSLDKTLIEATLSGLPVATSNPEYLKIFGSWSENESGNLLDEIIAVQSASRMELAEETLRRRLLCAEHHSLTSWVEKISRVLNG